MFRFGFALFGFIGLLFAQAGLGGFKIEYFYQNVFLSDTANVVLEFRLSECVGEVAVEGTIEFGDGKTEILTRIGCGRWRVPHTYFAKKDESGPKTYTAILKLGDKSAETQVAVAEPMPTQAIAFPSQPTTPKPSTGEGNGGGGGGGGGAPAPKPAPEPDETKDYTLKLERTKLGLSGYVAMVKVAEGEITGIEPIVFDGLGLYTDKGFCPPGNKTTCKFFAYIDHTDPQEKAVVWKEKTNIQLAKIKTKNVKTLPTLEILRANDMGPFGIFDQSVVNPVGDIPKECFCIVDTNASNNTCQAASQCPL